jgi:integration host factor subunit beta
VRSRLRISVPWGRGNQLFPSIRPILELPTSGLPGNSVILFRDAAWVPEVTRADLTKEVYQAIGMPLKESEVVVCAILNSIVRSLRSGDKVEIRGFGSFHTRQRRGRIGRNPKTGARVEVPPKKIPFFKSSKELRELVDGRTSTPERGTE